MKKDFTNFIGLRQTFILEEGSGVEVMRGLSAISNSDLGAQTFFWELIYG